MDGLFMVDLLKGEPLLVSRGASNSQPATISKTLIDLLYYLTHSLMYETNATKITPPHWTKREDVVRIRRACC